jgi:hypothetical protein
MVICVIHAFFVFLCLRQQQEKNIRLHKLNYVAILYTSLYRKQSDKSRDFRYISEIYSN